MWPTKRPHEQLVIHKGWNGRGICDIWVLRGSRSWANIQCLYLEFWHCWGRRVLKSPVIIAWTSEWPFPSSALDSPFTLTGGSHFLFCYETVKQRSTSARSVLQRCFPCPDPGALFRWRGRGVGCHEPFWHEHWLRTPCMCGTACTALPRRGFYRTSFLSLFPPRFSPLNLQDWLSPSPEQCLQWTFQWVTGNGPTQGRRQLRVPFQSSALLPKNAVDSA